MHKCITTLMKKHLKKVVDREMTQEAKRKAISSILIRYSEMSVFILSAVSLIIMLHNTSSSRS